MTGYYFNLELGEWEPMLENFTCDIIVNQTLSQKTFSVIFEGPVIINLTGSCLQNLSYTHEAWLSMPPFIKPTSSANTQALHQLQQHDPILMDSQVSGATSSMKLQLVANESHSSYSINSSSEGEIQFKVTPKKLQQVQETLRQDSFNPIIEEESKNGEMSQSASIITTGQM